MKLGLPECKNIALETHKQFDNPVSISPERRIMRTASNQGKCLENLHLGNFAVYKLDHPSMAVPHVVPGLVEAVFR